MAPKAKIKNGQRRTLSPSGLRAMVSDTKSTTSFLSPRPLDQSRFSRTGSPIYAMVPALFREFSLGKRTLFMQSTLICSSDLRLLAAKRSRSIPMRSLRMVGLSQWSRSAPILLNGKMSIYLRNSNKRDAIRKDVRATLFRTRATISRTGAERFTICKAFVH